LVQATDFNSALREDALALNVSTGSVIDAPGEPTDFIFDFSRAEIRNFERVDSDLVIILEDGSVTRINGYYDSVYDRALVFQEELETTASTSGLALAGLGLLGAGGLAAAAGGSSSSSSGGGPSIAITEDFGGADGVVSATERADGLPISGTATPGASIDVTLGSATLSTTADADGNWSVTFPANSVPTGEQDVLVNATATDDNGGTASDIATITIDTLVNDLTLDEAPEGGDGMVNAVEASDGVTLTGTVEPGATVVVTFNGEDYEATVAADGTWTLDIPAADIPAGNGVSHTIDITATDAAGNTDSLSETFIIDTTLTGPTVTAVPGGADETVNAEEAAAGVTVTGTVEPGSEVVVVFQGVEYPAAVDPDGNWMAPIPSSALPEGNGETTHGFEVHAVDEAGNTGSTSGTFLIDTTGSEIVIDDVPGGDGVINEDEAGDGISLGGEVDPGSTVIVIFEEVEYPADVDDDGNWEVTIPAEDIPEGTGDNSDITIVVTDPAGNVTEEPVTVEIDTMLENFTVTDVPGDDNIVENVPVVNIEEVDGGVTISGTVEIGGTVSVIFEGETYEAVVEDNGDWSVDIPEADIPVSNGDPYQIIVNAEDEAGNTGQIVEEFIIDNVAPEMPFISGFQGNSSGGFTDITIPTPEDGTELSFHTSAGSNATSQLEALVDPDGMGESDVNFGQEVADLIISATDGANNTQSTYYVFEQGGQNTTTDLSNAAFGSHDISAVNLDFEEVNLVLTEADVLALSSDTDTLFVQGNADDSVTLTGATTQGNTMTDDTTGQTYTEYTLGEATIWIENEIPTVNT